MADSGNDPNPKKGGIYEWSSGAKFSTLLGGLASATIGTKTEVAKSRVNAVALDASNSFRSADEVSLTFGKRYAYQGGDEVGFSKSAISIQESGSTRCLDLFQASAGLSPQSRGEFKAKRQEVERALRLRISNDIMASLTDVKTSDNGAGFDSKAASESKVATITSKLSSMASVSGIMAKLLTDFLDSQRGSTQPGTWAPTAVMQASSQHGILIANQQGLPDTVYSSFQQNDKGSVLTVSRGGQPEYSVGSVALDQQDIESLGEMGGAPALQESKLSLTEQQVSVSGQEVSLAGHSNPVDPLPDSKMTATFQDIQLVSTEMSAQGPSAQLDLKGSSPTASLVAQSAPGVGSSVQATAEALSLKSGETSSVELGVSDISVSSLSVAVSGQASASISAPQVSISGDATVSISGALVRIG